MFSTSGKENGLVRWLVGRLVGRNIHNITQYYIYKNEYIIIYILYYIHLILYTSCIIYILYYTICIDAPCETSLDSAWPNKSATIRSVIILGRPKHHRPPATIATLW